MSAPELSAAEAARVAEFEAAPAAPESWPTTLGVEQVQEFLAHLRGITDDDERAHGYEDSLRDYALRLIAEGAANPETIALVALATGNLPFKRWAA